MQMRHPLLLAALTAAACATTPTIPAGPPESIELRFAPRPGSARFELTDVRTVRFGGNEQVRRSSVSSTNWVLEVAEGFAIVDEDVRLETDPPNPVLQALTAQVAERIKFIVNRDGEPTSIQGLDELQPALLEWFDGLDLGQAPPQVVEQLRAAVMQASDPDQLIEREASNWHARVGIWTGKRLEIGRPHDIPEHHTTIRAVERLPCVRGEPDNRCVRLALTYTPTQQDLQPALQLAAQALAAQGAGQVTGMTSVERVDLVVLPETLEPFRMEKQRLMITTLERDGQRYTIERDEVKTSTWRYE